MSVKLVIIYCYLRNMGEAALVVVLLAWASLIDGAACNSTVSLDETTVSTSTSFDGAVWNSSTSLDGPVASASTSFDEEVWSNSTG